MHGLHTSCVADLIGERPCCREPFSTDPNDRASESLITIAGLPAMPNWEATQRARRFTRD